ncbi:MAG: carboxypeptidase regulatory-like domain-containing protein [Nitrospirales bacterium]|nr:carboxypeptidase regulatory-like domain-containing protein [Nitrospirales bacterium]
MVKKSRRKVQIMGCDNTGRKSVKIALVLLVWAVINAVTIPNVCQAGQWDISLYSGWNLVAFPVVPADPKTEVVLNELIKNNELESLWAFDPQSEEWQVFVPNQRVPGVSSISKVETGRGYWMKVTRNQTLSITSTEVPIPVPSVKGLSKGWNLMATSADEKKPFDRIFRGVPIKQIWTFNAAGGYFQGVVLPVSGIGEPNPQDFYEMKPDQGYWVQVGSDQPMFGPGLGTSMPGDIDVMPLLPASIKPGERIPWSEITPGDEDIGRDQFFDTSATQRAIVFRNPVTLQNITLFNTGNGVLSFVARIENQSSRCGEVPPAPLSWLRFKGDTSDPDEAKELLVKTGSVATESTSLPLEANRMGLLPGLYCAEVMIQSNGTLTGEAGDDLIRYVKVFVEIPELEGDYEIITTIDTINGKKADVSSPVFFMSLYRDAGGLKAVLDPARTLLLPRSVRMIGSVYEDETNRFQLSGSFSMPPGEEGNPYNTILRRDINFLGKRREREDPVRSGAGPLHLSGSYSETIAGPYHQPIHMVGTFEGRLVNTKPSAVGTTIGRSFSIQPIPDGGSAVYELPLSERFLIKHILATMKITHDNPTDLWIRLRPPSDLGLQELTLRRHSDYPLGAIAFGEQHSSGDDVSSLQPSYDDLSVLGGKLSPGVWTLHIQDEEKNGKAGQIENLALTISGTPMVSITGNVNVITDSVRKPEKGVSVLLSGCGLSLRTQTDADGAYRFADLIDCTYRVSAQKRSYQSKSVDVTIGPGEPDRIVNMTLEIQKKTLQPITDLPCERQGVGTCTGSAFEWVTVGAGAGAVLPHQELKYVRDSATFDIDRFPFGAPPGHEDTTLLSDAENPVTQTNACVTMANPNIQSSPCIEPGDEHINGPVGANSMQAYMSIGSPVIGRAVRGSVYLRMGVQP